MHRVLLPAAALAAALGVAPAASGGVAFPGSPSGAERLLHGVARSDGMEVSNARGVAVVTGDAAVIGRADDGLLTVVRRPGSSASVAVFGEEWRSEASPTKTLYRGRSIRFRVAGEGVRVAIAGRDLDLSVAARGYGAVRGEAGAVRLVGRATLAMPSRWRTFVLGAADGGPPTLRSLLRHEIRWMRVQGMSWAEIKRTDVWHAYRSLGGS